MEEEKQRGTGLGGLARGGMWSEGAKSLQVRDGDESRASIVPGEVPGEGGKSAESGIHIIVWPVSFWRVELLFILVYGPLAVVVLRQQLS